MRNDAYGPTVHGPAAAFTVDVSLARGRPRDDARGSEREPDACAPGWIPVSIDSACPTCGEHAGCCVHELERFVCCVNVHSEWPLTTGGWLHSAPLANSAHAAGWLSSVHEARSSFVSRRAFLRTARSEA